MSELLALVLGLAGAGVVSGFLAGLFGVGGGAIMVPVIDQFLAWLGYADDVRLHVALGTSLAIIIPTSWRSFASHRARAAVDMDLLKSWLLWVPAGTFVAAALASHVSGATLRAIFIAIAGLLIVKLVFRLGSVRIAEDIPRGPARWIAGLAIGCASGLMGIGGGVLSTTYMTLYGRAIHNAIATSAGVGLMIAVPGALGYMIAGLGNAELPPYSIGYVNLITVAIVAPLSHLSAPLGVRVAHAATKRQLELGFAGFLIVVCTRFVFVIVRDW